MVGLVLLGLVLIGGWGWQKSRTSNTQEQTQTARVEKGNLVKSLTLSGTVVQSNLLSVYTKASGIVNKVYVTDGQTVKAGDKLAEITLDADGQNNQASAWASYLNAKKGFPKSSP